ncbi:MAG: hypothetical protein RR280_10110, partial [Bacteroidaceae bacterium]
IEGIYWYLPAKQELRQLCVATCGLKLVASDAVAGAGEIADWDSFGMLDYMNYLPNRRLFYEKITTAKGTLFGSGIYGFYSSTDDLSDVDRVSCIYLSDGQYVLDKKKEKYENICAVSAF